MNSVTWDKERIHNLLDNNPKAVQRGLVAIFNRQTESEKASDATHNHNNVGFSAYDAPFCSDLAKRVIKGNSLSAKQLEIARNKLKRYHRQLIEIANANEFKKAKSYVSKCVCAENEFYDGLWVCDHCAAQGKGISQKQFYEQARS